MKRAALERTRTVETWRRHLAAHDQPIACDCEFEIGRFRKGQRVGGCGRPRCFLCHFAKLSHLPRIADRRWRVEYREGIAELSWPNPAFDRTRRSALFFLGGRRWRRAGQL
jgi:hypothetical protein